MINYFSIKKIFLFIISLCFTLLLNAQVSKAINVTAGGLSSSLTATELSTVTNLTLTGTIDARDFKTMRDDMPLLAELDLSGATVVGYTGTEGTNSPNSYTYLANIVPGSAFQSKQSLISVKFPSSIVSIGTYAFGGCTGLTTFNIPTSVTSIGYSFCQGCTGLTSVTIPLWITSIGEGAFSECKNLTSVAILSPTTTIDKRAFGNCFKLTSLTVAWVNPPHLWDYTFGFVDRNLCILHVPFGMATRYTNDIQWKSFVHIVEPASGFSLSTNTTKVASVAGSTSTVEVIANVNWTASSDQSWLSVSPSNGTGNQTLTFTAEANPLFTIRKAKITVSSTGFESQTVIVTQNGSTLTLNLSPGGLASALATEEFQGITNLILTGSIDATDFKIIRDKMALLTELDLSEVTIAKYKGPDGTWDIPDGYFNDYYPENTIPRNSLNGQQLTSIILPKVLSSIGDYSLNSHLSSVTVYWPIPLVLSPNSVTFNYLNNCILHVPYGTASLYKSAERWRYFPQIVEADKGFFVSSHKVNIAGEEGSLATVDIKANVNWTVSSDQDWLVVSPTSGKDNQTLTFTAKANPLITTRTAIVTVSETGVSSQTITVTQIFQIQPKTLELTAGGLSTALSTDELNTISKLTLTGTIDARDFKTMRDNMPLLVVVDLSGATVVGYKGTEGTSGTSSYTYPANTIPDYSFYNSNSSEGNTWMTTIILPSLITSIGSSAFHNCTSLTSVTIPASVTIIASDAFNNCTGLTSVTIPSSVTTIESYAFNNCTGLTSVTIPSSVTIIGSSVFFGCNGLTSIKIPSSVNHIGSYAFGNCWMLSSIYVNSLIPIDLSSSIATFYDLNKPTITLYVPSGSKAAYQAADQWKDFINIVEMPGLFLSANSINMGANAGTAELSIGSSSDWTATSNQDWLTLSPTSGTVGASTLTLTATTNPDNTNRKATITVSATGFESQTITVNQYRKVEVTAGKLKTVLAGQLSTITNLTLTGTIDARDFKTMRDEMPLLTTIDLSGATVVEYTGTEGTSGINNYTYPANTVPDNSFYNSNSGQGKIRLTAINLPVSVTSIGNSAFYNCTGLPSVAIPESVTSIGNSLFYNCTGLTSVMIPSSVTTIGSSAFYNCTGLTSVAIPVSVTSIGNSAFYNCTGLTSMTIPLSVKTIRNNTFYNCAGLTTINIPSSVSSIEDWAFGFCNKVSLIQASSPLPINLSSSFNVFYSINKTTTILKVSSGSKAAYQAANQWREFTNIVEIPGLFLWADSIGMGTNAGTAKLSLGSSSDWTATSDQQWLTLSPTSGTVGASTLTLTATTNPDNTNRKATITVSAQGVESKTITVTQYSKVEIAAGNLKTLLANQLSIITNLTLTGTIDARDFKTMRDNMPLLAVVDLSGATIVEYVGTEGTYYYTSSYTYSASAVPDYAFYNPNSGQGKIRLTAIMLPLSVTSLGSSAFSSCIGLTSVTITSSVTSIGSNAFRDCTGLTSVTIPASVTSICESAFQNCSGLTSITIPSSVNSIGSYAFGSCYKLRSIQASSPMPINFGSSYNIFYEINKTTTILNVPFGSKTAYQSAYQWKDFTNIIEIPGLFLSVNSLDISANAGTVKLSIASSSDWSVVSDQAWLTLSTSSGKIGVSSFILTITANPDSTIRSATITVTATGYESQTIAVTQYSNVVVTAGNLKDRLAGQLSTITNLTLSGTIDARDFKTMRDEMPFLKVVDLSEATVVGYAGKEGTYGMYEYTYPANTIPDYSFYNRYTSKGKTSLTSITLSTSGSTIGSNAFYNCTGLTSINIPSSFTYIGSEAFGCCSSLTYIVIPSSVTSIGNWVFFNCINVNYIKANSPSPINLSSSPNTFFAINKTTTILYVPSGSKAAYQAADQWKDFTNIVEMSGLFLSANSLNMSANAGTDKISIASSSEWTAISDQEWLTLSPASGVVGASTLTLTATTNPDNTNRTAILTISATGLESQTITVIQYGKVEVTAGNLKDRLAGQLSTITNLTLIGTIDARDFKTMRDEMPLLDMVDLSEITVVEYIGTEGTAGTDNYTYPANTIPDRSFFNPFTIQGKTSLTTIVLPLSVTSIGSDAFRNCSCLTTITIPSSVISIESLAFYNCTGLTSINIPSSVTTIESSVFWNCSGLTSVTIPSSVTSIGNDAFGYCSGLTSIYIPSSVTSIGSFAFEFCSGLTSVTIPSSVTTIESSVFRNCSNLTSVTIPPSVTFIGNDAFVYCSGLTSINIPSSVTSIGSSVFRNCSSLTSVTIPSSVISIGDGAFQNCSGLTSVTIPSSVTIIESSVFRNCSGLTSVTIPSSVTSIGSYAFQNCSGLTSINIPLSVTKIDFNAFYNCSGLTSVNIPSTVTSIGSLAFRDCSSLTSINIPSSVTSIGSYAFGDCSKISSIQANSSVPINLSNSYDVFYGINKTTTVLNVPYGSKAAYQAANQWKNFVNIVEMPGLFLSANSISMGANAGTDKLSIVSSSDWIAVSDQEWLTLSPVSGTMGTSSLTLNASANPDTTIRTATVTVSATGLESQTIIVTQYGKVEVTAGNLKDLLAGQLSTITNLTLTGTIDARDFRTMRDEMPLLSDVDLSRVTIVEYTGPEGTKCLVSYKYPANTVPDCSFYNPYLSKGKTSLIAMILPSSVTSIGSQAFMYCSNLTTINIPSFVTSIKNQAFFRCSSLTSITFPPSVTSIESEAFYICSSLTSVTIPSSITSIESSTFAFCVGLTSVTIPSSVTSIGNNAFLSCKSLTSIDIPSSVITIESNAFQSCTSLTSINIPSSVTSIKSSTFDNCSSLTFINIPTSVTSIGTDAFKNCTDLTLINIPSSVTSIGNSAFFYCTSVTSINISSSVTSIGDWAFGYCLMVSSIYVHSPLPINLSSSPDVFNNINKTTTILYVPSGSKAAYQVANQWKDFLNIVETTGFNLSANTVSLDDAAESTATVEITSNAAWIASSDQTWLTVSPTSGTGNQTITFTAQANTSAASRIATVTVSATNVNSQTIVVMQEAYLTNNPPIANAGKDQNVNRGETVTLDGSASSDSDKNSLSYKWTAPAGITLSSISVAKPTFTAPEVFEKTNYTFSLVVNDGIVDSPADQVIISVINNKKHFNTVWIGSGYDHMNINIYSAKLNGVDLEAGDEIGIFDGDKCVGSGILTSTITQTSLLNMVVSRYYGLGGDGYTPGNAITYKLFDASKNIEVTNVATAYSDNMPGWSTDGKFDIGASAFVELTGLTKVIQDIPLNIGWNIISANVIPDNPNLKDIFQSLIDAGKLKKVMDETGKTIENFGAFGGWKNNIGNLNSAKGYKVNVLSNSTLSLEGTPVSLPLDITLNTGRNIISYPSATAQDAKALVQLLIDTGKLKKVMDEAGKTIENFGAFGGWKNNIGNFLPGKGYKVNVLENCTLTIPATANKAAKIVPEVMASTHFTKAFKGNGTDHMNIHLVNLQASGLQTGDEIGIYDGKLCVGSQMIGPDQLMAGSISIPASANDELGESINGFTSGHPVELQLYRGTQIYKVKLEKLGGSELFEKNESLFVQANTSKLTTIQIADNSAQFRCFPNPFTHEITIEVQNLSQAEITVEIYNMAGQRIKNLFKGTSSGHLVLKWNGTNDSGQQVALGVYLCKVNGQSKQVVFEGGKAK